MTNRHVEGTERRNWLEKFITDREDGYYECDPILIAAYAGRYNAGVNRSQNTNYFYCLQLSEDLAVLRRQQRLTSVITRTIGKPVDHVRKEERKHIIDRGHCRKYAFVFRNVPQDGEI